MGLNPVAPRPGRWKMSKITVVVRLVAIIAISAVGMLDNNRSINYGGYNSFSNSPFLTLTANITNPSPQANFTYGYMSPNLWDYYSGSGIASVYAYDNSSIKENANITSFNNSLSIFGYPSEHFTYKIPMPLQTVYTSSLASFVSYDIKKISNQVINDVAYDMFLGQNNTLQDEVEIMLLDHMTNRNWVNGSGLTAVIPIMVNGITYYPTWNIGISRSASGSFPLYTFVPPESLFNNSSASVNISFTPFLKYLQGMSLISPAQSIIRLGIGSEFSYVNIGQSSMYYSFWLYSYFILNGTKYHIIQPSGGV